MKRVVPPGCVRHMIHRTLKPAGCLGIQYLLYIYTGIIIKCNIVLDVVVSSDSILRFSVITPYLIITGKVHRPLPIIQAGRFCWGRGQ